MPATALSPARFPAAARAHPAVPPAARPSLADAPQSAAMGDPDRHGLMVVQPTAVRVGRLLARFGELAAGSCPAAPPARAGARAALGRGATLPARAVAVTSLARDDARLADAAPVGSTECSALLPGSPEMAERGPPAPVGGTRRRAPSARSRCR